MTLHRRDWLQAGIGVAASLTLSAFTPPARAEPVDHGCAAWTVLVARHMLPQRGGQASKVRYASVAAAHRSLPGFMARFAEVLADAPTERERIHSESVQTGFGDCDWKLNDAR